MITIPNMAKVADLQRRYRYLVNEMKKTGKPIVVLNNGNPDAVVMDVATYNLYVERMNELTESYLLGKAEEGLREYKAGKTKTLKKGQKLLDLLE